MRYRILTISRQYGSGGARIASVVAERLGWRLLDSQITDTIAQSAHMNSSVVRTHDEHAATWFHRLNRDTMRCAALMTGRPSNEEDFFDSDAMVSLTRKLIEQAAESGNCVIVGRGSQCILAACPDVFRAYVYAPCEQRLHSVRLRTGNHINKKQLDDEDEQRARYIYTYFGRHWQDPDLYDLMISSKHGDEITASTILRAMECEPSGIANPAITSASQT